MITYGALLFSRSYVGKWRCGRTEKKNGEVEKRGVIFATSSSFHNCGRMSECCAKIKYFFPLPPFRVYGAEFEVVFAKMLKVSRIFAKPCLVRNVPAVLR